MKILLILLMFFLTGCSSIIDDGVKVSDDTKYGLAKNSIYKYVECIKNGYSNYQYSSMLGEYSSGDTSVIVDGKEIFLEIYYTGDDITCDKIDIDSGKVYLNNCSIYGYSFNYENGKIIDNY